MIPLTIVGLAAISFGSGIGLKILNKLNKEIMRKLIYAFVGIFGILTVAQQIP